MVTIRLAAPADVAALCAIAVAAYQKYIPRIGRAPAPMTADYAHAVRSGQAWAAVRDGRVVGFAVLIAQPGFLLLENMAVLPAAQNRGVGARLLGTARVHRDSPRGAGRIPPGVLPQTHQLTGLTVSRGRLRLPP
jgi:GNAT superfamily N-acetyltransferase